MRNYKKLPFIINYANRAYFESDIIGVELVAGGHQYPYCEEDMSFTYTSIYINFNK